MVSCKFHRSYLRVVINLIAYAEREAQRGIRSLTAFKYRSERFKFKCVCLTDCKKPTI